MVRNFSRYDCFKYRYEEVFEMNDKLEDMKKVLIDYAKKQNYSQVIIETIEESESERRLQMLLEILEEKGELTTTQITYAILTD